MTACVVCGSGGTEVLSRVRPSISSDRRVIDAAVTNVGCADCGAVHNADGSRTHVQEFYAETYDLHGEGALSEWQVHVDGAARGENDAILEFILRACPMRETGRVLEIGCGKGILLGKLLRARPGWTAAAVEPSLHATAYFKRILPQVRIHEGILETSPFAHETFDLVATSGVLEHVVDPMAFLAGLRATIAPGGCAYVGVPNFAAKPDDLLVFDHLTRLTPASLDTLYARTGLRLLERDARADRVWLWDAVVPCEPQPARRDPRRADAEIRSARAHVAEVARARESFGRMLATLDAGRDVAAIFGMGVLGLLEFTAHRERAGAVRYILEDNPHIWGTTKFGVEVRGSGDAGKLGVTAAFLSANPCYHDRMRAKLVAAGVPAGRIFG